MVSGVLRADQTPNYRLNHRDHPSILEHLQDVGPNGPLRGSLFENEGAYTLFSFRPGISGSLDASSEPEEYFVNSLS